MTLDELYQELDAVATNVAALDPADRNTYLLKNQLIEVKKALMAETLNGDANVALATGANIAGLLPLMAAAKAATDRSQLSGGTMGKIVGIAGIVFRSLGLGF